MPLVLPLAAAFPALAPARHVRLAGLQLQQRLIRRLLGRQRLRQRSGDLRRLRELRDRFLHLGRRRGPRRLRPGRTRLLHRLLGLRERLLLRLGDDLRVVRIFRRQAVALEAPGRVDDLLLQIDQLARLVAALLLVLLVVVRVHALALPENFVERPHLGEKQVAARAPHLPVGPDIVGPRMPRNQVVGLRADVLEPQQVRKGPLLLRAGGSAKFNELRFTRGHRVGNAVGRSPEVVEHRALEGDFLQRRRAHIAARQPQPQLGHAVRLHVDHKRRGNFVGAAVRVHELQIVGLRLRERERREHRHGLARRDRQRNRRLLAVARDQLRRRHRLVELQRVVERRALHRADAARVLDMFRRKLRVAGKREIRIRPHEARVLKHGDLELAGLPAAVFKMVGEIDRDLGDAAAEHGIGEALHERNRPRRHVGLLHHQGDRRRQRPAKPREHHQAVAPLDARIAGRHRDAVGAAPHGLGVLRRRGDAHLGERKSETQQRGDVRDLRPGEPRGRDDLEPVLFLAFRGRLLHHAVLEVAGLRPRREVLLHRGQQHALQLRMRLFDLLRRPAEIGRRFKMLDHDPRRHRHDHRREQRKHQGRAPPRRVLQPRKRERDERRHGPPHRELAPQPQPLVTTDDPPQFGFQELVVHVAASACF